MKKLALTLGLLLSTSAFADNTLMFEVGLGLGKQVKSSNLDQTLCKNRDAKRLTYVGMRLRSDDIELYGARWWHNNEDFKCDRSSYSVGLGYVVDGTHISWTPGIAYVWSNNKDYKNQTRENTTWTLSEPIQVFNRLAVYDGDADAELAYINYGLFEKDNQENFITLGLKTDDLNRSGSANESVNNTSNNTTIINVYPGNGFGDENHEHEHHH